MPKAPLSLLTAHFIIPNQFISMHTHVPSFTNVFPGIYTSNKHLFYYYFILNYHIKCTNRFSHDKYFPFLESLLSYNTDISASQKYLPFFFLDTTPRVIFVQGFRRGYGPRCYWAETFNLNVSSSCLGWCF